MSNQTKKILVMSIGTDLGGIEKSMINFLQFLSSESAFQIDLYLWRKPGKLYNHIPSSINILDDDVSPVGIRDCKNISDLLLYFKFRFLDLFSLGTKALKKINCDYDIAIAYCQVGHTPYYVIDKISARKKYFFYHHGSYGANRLRHFIDSTYYSAFDAIITMSNANAEMIKKVFPKCQNKTRTCSPFINEKSIIEKSRDNASPKEYSDGIPILVTVARLSIEKGIMEALQSAKILKDKGIKFKWLFVGSGADRLSFDNYIEENDLSDVCILVGGKENPYAFMSIATIYVQPSNVESFCITIREAAILNKPIVASDIPAVCEASYEIANIRLSANDPERMANTIEQILSDSKGLALGTYNTSLKSAINEKSIKFFRNLFALSN